MTIQNAKTPGRAMKSDVLIVEAKLSKKGVANTLRHPSQTILMTAKVRPIIGDNQKIVAAGLSIPISLFRISS